MAKIIKTLAIISCALAYSSLVKAQSTDFYTIIGPDGRPMIVQRNAPKPQKRTDSISKRVEQSRTTDSKEKENATRSQVTQSAQLETKKDAIAKRDDISKTDVQMPSDKSKALLPAELTSKPQPVIQPNRTQKTQIEVPQKEAPRQKPENLTRHLEQNTSVVNNKGGGNPDTRQDLPKDLNKTLQTQNVQSKKESPITQIDGVEYVDNEYLEDREFNLEGKKRFYIMPDSSVGGARRFETVEREKGISKSIFSKFSAKTAMQSTPVVLAPTYYRLSKEEVVESLEQACFTGKKIDKAKTLSLDNHEMGVWPVPPIKEKFVYDVVKLDHAVQNIHFSSYASSQKSPSYYWPLVVFLDQQGCVIEGVSGFKNENIQSTHLSYAALEGVLKKPSNAIYMFMTPLSEAIDVQNIQLTNKGQVKLSVLR